ncbi:4Fe-4S binding protein [Sedimentibacter hydroxybenzoicus DSM 7310]|uniref:4Fe-4S binding protein n=1 Tax=Sedimentibacter hydroxybenzoicus DSM 7310 TaxID=1123245 RepID=A0A974BKC9_SEDHY|nr:4Fe-4S dicluster domain-containing protein [Sedimentibacter hydroxybenzoicus]NYB74682.1 4Fe-4S binding protein [Sedimentibacter hydroxybenzoicus DSM 7310]
MSYSVVDKNYCKGCLRCISVCPKECLGLSGRTNDGGYDYVEFKEGSPCIGCALCYMVCPDVAITVHKEK